jgi:hypothetical protein
MLNLILGATRGRHLRLSDVKPSKPHGRRVAAAVFTNREDAVTAS